VSFAPFARFGSLTARDLREVSRNTSDLTTGRWAVAIGFEGQMVLARFAQWQTEAVEKTPWFGVGSEWTSSMTREQYESGVRAVQAEIAKGWVYQVNLCRVLRAPCEATDLSGLYDRLASMRAPFGGLLHLPDLGVRIASASPERFLTRRAATLSSSPIKGTASTPDGFLAKDVAENVMIVDLVRNDLGRVASTGSVEVGQLLGVEPYPGLFHLVSTVNATTSASWSEILAATLPPGSVSGAPKHSALDVIGRLEPCQRQWYCGAFGWIDVDQQRAELAVAIRTFWLADGMLHFGTGAGITWASDPAGEWEETQLKAQRLIALASERERD
jgi:para-aminobenzoate synthetase component 1